MAILSRGNKEGPEEVAADTKHEQLVAWKSWVRATQVKRRAYLKAGKLGINLEIWKHRKKVSMHEKY